MTKEELLADIELCDGYEVPRELWPLAEQLVADKRITLGGPRGPNREWRRAELED